MIEFLLKRCLLFTFSYRTTTCCLIILIQRLIVNTYFLIRYEEQTNGKGNRWGKTKKMILIA